MALWPFPPLEGAIEALAWRTDLLRPKASEQRQALRSIPRMAFTYEHYLTPVQVARARATLYGNGAQVIGLPVWTEHAYVGAVSAGATSLSFDTSYADYRAGGQALLWIDDSRYEAVNVSGVSGSGLTLSAPVANSYIGALVAPLRQGRAPQGLVLSRAPKRVVRGSVTFEVDDTADLANEGSAPLYRSYPMMLTPAIVGDGSIEEKVWREVDGLDNDAGRPVYDPVTSLPTQTFSVAWHVVGRARLWALRGFLHARRGQQKGFWLPTWNRDFQLTANAGSSDTTLTVRATGYPGAYTVRDIFIEAPAALLYRRVTHAVTSGDNEILYLESTVGAALTTAQNPRIGLLHFVRFTADRIEIQHYHDSAAVAVSCQEAPVPS